MKTCTPILSKIIAPRTGVFALTVALTLLNAQAGQCAIDSYLHFPPAHHAASGIIDAMSDFFRLLMRRF